MTIFIDPDCLACTICYGPVGGDYHLIRDGAGGVACDNCQDEGLMLRRPPHRLQARTVRPLRVATRPTGGHMTEEGAAQMNYDLGHSRGFSAGVTAERERIRRRLQQETRRLSGMGLTEAAAMLRSLASLLEPATPGGTEERITDGGKP